MKKYLDGNAKHMVLIKENILILQLDLFDLQRTIGFSGSTCNIYIYQKSKENLSGRKSYT